MDVCVDSRIDFKVLSLHTPNNNASVSSVRIQFASKDEAKLQQVFDEILALATSTRFELAQAAVMWDVAEASAPAAVPGSEGEGSVGLVT
jgi:hypothetical protein